MTDDDALFMLVADGEIRGSGDRAQPVAWLEREQLGLAEHEAHWVPLGTLDGRPRHAALRIGEPRLSRAVPFRPPRQGGYIGLHHLHRASAQEQQFAARALHMSAWLHHSAHCPSCGHACTFHSTLGKRICTACGFDTYPRIEPAVIVLVTDGDHCLLARQGAFPKGYYAPLAGFVEAGETPEQAAAREVQEETGQRIAGAHYVASQPWPYPGSLMLGFIAGLAQQGSMVLSSELEEAAWFSRAAVQEAMAQPGTGALFLPPRGVIGCILIERWLASKQ